MNTVADLPDWARDEITRLRKDVAKFRTRAKENHAARQQLDAVKAVLAMSTTQGDNR